MKSADRRLLEAAIAYAVKAHAGQVDLNGEAYIRHPLRVMEMGRTTEEQILGALHDVIEDSGGWAGNTGIIAIVGPPDAVLHEALDALTKRRTGTRKASGDYWKEPYAQYIRRCGANPLAARVKLHDLADNMAPWRQATLPAKFKRRFRRRHPAAVRYLKGRV